jgi:ATP-binding cassette subfamily B protein
MIAHRLSTIAHADEIFVMEKGSLSEHGIHDKLLTKKGLYAALWREQGVV